MSSGSTESQCGLRHINGVPVWNGDVLTLRDYETAALRFRSCLKLGEQERAVARLWANLQGPAKEVIRMCKEYISYYRKLATKTVYLQPEQQHEQ